LPSSNRSSKKESGRKQSVTSGKSRAKSSDSSSRDRSANSKNRKTRVIRGNAKPGKTEAFLNQGSISRDSTKIASSHNDSAKMASPRNDSAKMASPRNDSVASIAAAYDSNNPVGSVKKQKVFDISTQKWRHVTIGIITGALIFSSGVQIGSRSESSIVDNAIDVVIETGAKELDRTLLERAAIAGVLNATGDEWANYFPKSALSTFEDQNLNMFTGIGVLLTKTRGGQIKIASIQSDSPATNSGLRAGDQVLEVNGTDVRGATLTSVISLIRGSSENRIELLVSRNDRKILAALSAKKIVARNVVARQFDNEIALISISSFGAGTAKSVKETLDNFKYDSGVIVDLRNNPGGLIEEAVQVAQLFIGGGVVVSYQVNGSEKVFRVENPSPIKAPVVVIINRNTASSAEILAGAFQDRNRGVVIGERSYGKGSVQEIVTLSDGSKIELTVALYRTSSGRVIDEVGITPDLQVLNSEVGVKALQVLGGLASLISRK
jgi:carboxyl-terminal processing protease